MMIFISIYSVVDGLFVSNCCTTAAFAAVNIAFPIINFIGAVAFMFGWGGSALFTKKLGEKDPETANRYFSLITYVSIFVSIILSVAVYFVLPPLCKALGATGEMYEEAVRYGRILSFFGPFYLIQMEFQSYFVAAEKPKLGLVMTIISGCFNMLFDFIFVYVCKFGIQGAAYATGLSFLGGGLFSIIYFSCKNNSLLRLGKTKIEFPVIGKTMFNGISELITNVSLSVVAILYNAQLIKYLGDNGVAAYGVIMYVALIFLGIFFGYNIGIAPLISYNLGAKNNAELHNLTIKSQKIIIIFSLFTTALSYALAYPLALAYGHGDQELIKLTTHAFMYFSAMFIFAGVPIFASSFFTALNDGLVSGLISVFRTLIFQILCIEILPLIFGSDGIWASLFVAEIFSLVLAMFCVFKFRKKYGY